jgi:hypothetical protein
MFQVAEYSHVRDMNRKSFQQGKTAMAIESESTTCPNFVLSADGEIYGEGTSENQEIVRRIHACVQACEGISTDELENGIVLDMWRALAAAAPLLESRDTPIT